MFHSKIKFIIVIMFFIGRIIMMYSEQPKTSWGEYNYSFWEILKLKKSADKGRYEDAYKLGMHYYVIEKDDERSIFWLQKAASGNHIDAIRELIKYYLLFESNESKKIIEDYKNKLEEIAIEEKRTKNFYYGDLAIDLY